MKDLHDYSLLAHNTFGIDARCRRFIEYSSVDEALEIPDMLTAEDYPLLIIGSGSNLLLTQDYPATVVHSAIKGIEVVRETEDSVWIECGSGELFDDVVSYCVDHGYYGMENLSLIPGEVGASAVQNIGAYGAEAKDLIYYIDAVEIDPCRRVLIYSDHCEYGYRQSKFKQDWKDSFLIVSVTYRLSKHFRPSLDYGNIRASLEQKGISEPTAHQLRDTIIEIRQAKLPDPAVQGNAGSFFMNPIVDREKYEQLAARYPGMPHYTVDDAHEKIPAGWMIDQCGWKGKNLGRAGVHDKQALVLVNLGGATGNDIVRLCQKIQQDVKQKFDIEIYPEVNIK